MIILICFKQFHIFKQLFIKQKLLVLKLITKNVPKSSKWVKNLFLFSLKLKFLKKKLKFRTKIKLKEAARHRRNKENNEISNLADLLPIRSEIAKQLDKASILRLTISFFQVRL